MSSELPIIEARGIWKRYPIGGGPTIDGMGMHRLIGEVVRKPWDMVAGLLPGGDDSAPTSPTEIWAIKDLTFDVRLGETLGVVGANGAGKSVLLKILTRITRPTRGSALIRGRVGAMLEVSAGFHPQLTGRENIFLSGAILGMSQRDIARRFAQIVEYAGVSELLDTPVKRYSSGMTARLAFAVAAHLDAEIMLVDEVLAVGDESFRRRCIETMRSLARSGRTILFVSHELDVLESLCDRAILLNHGSLVTEGLPNVVIERYLQASTPPLGSSGS